MVLVTCSWVMAQRADVPKKIPSAPSAKAFKHCPGLENPPPMNKLILSLALRERRYSTALESA